jgi:hypothetical protein
MLSKRRTTEPLMSSLSIELESKSAGDCSTVASRNAVHDQAHAPSSQCLSLFLLRGLLSSSASLHTSLLWTRLCSLACRDVVSQCVVCLLSHRLVLSSFLYMRWPSIHTRRVLMFDVHKGSVIFRSNRSNIDVPPALSSSLSTIYG